MSCVAVSLFTITNINWTFNTASKPHFSSKSSFLPLSLSSSSLLLLPSPHSHLTPICSDEWFAAYFIKKSGALKGRLQHLSNTRRICLHLPPSSLIVAELRGTQATLEFVAPQRGSQEGTSVKASQ